jgi:hypothetical protein
MLKDYEIIEQAREMMASMCPPSDKCEVVVKYPFTINIEEPTTLFSEVKLTFNKKVHADGNHEWCPTCIRVHDAY